MTKMTKGSDRVWWIIAVALVPILIIMSKVISHDPISYALPNLLLFTSFREEAKALWHKLINIDTSIEYDAAHVPIIQVESFSLEALQKATDNWKHPCVVRNMFSDAPALKRWTKRDYLPSKIGEYEIPVVRKAVYGTLQNDRGIMPFGDAFKEIFDKKDSKMYLFFPVKSRTQFSPNETKADIAKFKAQTDELSDKINEIVLEDLEINKRLWNGFGTKRHKTYIGSQFIIGRGSADSQKTTGTGWHCAPGNNWFIQVIGSKRWYFMDQEYSSIMHPLRGGKINMQQGNLDLADLQKHFPHRYADLYPGDLLYNPDWEWHTIKNYEGFSMGVPIRELNISLSLRNNFQYTSIVLINKALEVFGLDIGGYPNTTANVDAGNKVKE